MNTHNSQIAWSLKVCARQHGVTIREIAKGMGITLKRVREVRNAATVAEITAWCFVVEIKRIASAKRGTPTAYISA